MVQTDEQQQIERWRKEIVRYDDVDPRLLKPREDNPKDHPQAQLDGLEGLISVVGWVAPVIVNEPTMDILDGHARVEKAVARGEPTVPVAYVNVTEERARLILATFDPIGQLAKIDQSRTGELIANQAIQNKQLVQFLATIAPVRLPPEEKPIPDVPKTPVTQPGEIWILGKHRLMCGDCTNADDAHRLFEGVRPKLCVTSPPYWVGREYEQEHDKAEIIEHIERSAAAHAAIMADRCHIALNTGTTVETKNGGDIRRVWLLLDWWQASFAPLGFNMRNVRIWSKEGGFGGFAPQQDVVGMDWEFLASFTRHPPLPMNRLPTSEALWALAGVWNIQPQTASVGHPAPFPIEIPSRYIQLYTSPNDPITDLYGGAGTTLIAGAQLDRAVYLMERMPGYCDVAVERWENLSGEKARRVGAVDNRIRSAHSNAGNRGADRGEHTRASAERVVPSTRTAHPHSGHVNKSKGNQTDA